MGNKIEQKTGKRIKKDCNTKNSSRGKNYSHTKGDKIHSLPFSARCKYFYKNIFSIKIQFDLSQSIKN